MKKIIIFLMMIFACNLSYATLTVDNVPKVKTGGTSPALENSSITESDGNVGINNTSPAYTLDVNGTVNATAFVGDGSGLSGVTGVAGSDTQVTFNDNGTSAGNAGFIFQKNTGTVTATHFVGDGAGLTGVGSSTSGWTTDSLTKTTSTYNVGIGSTSPTQLLDVRGTISSFNSSPLIISAKGFGCKLDSNITTGGGTDDSVCLQNALNTIAANSAGGELIIDGVALISAVNISATLTNPPLSTEQSTALKVGSNTTIRVIKGGGVFLAPNSNCTMLGNFITGAVGATYQNNIAIIGGIWNGNEANQGTAGGSGFPLEKNTAGNWLVLGFWFGSADKITLRDLEIRNASGYQTYFTNTSNVVIENVILNEERGTTAFKHFDGFHFDGNATNVHVTNVSCNGDDDCIALNTGEGYHWFTFYAAGYGVGRFPNVNTMDDQSNMTFENFYFNSPFNGIRFYDNGGASPTLNNIYFHNMFGNITTVFMQNASGIQTGNITIDGWYVTGKGNILVGSATDTNHLITLKNLVFKNWDNTSTPNSNQPINIYGSGKSTISGVVADATVNTATANQLIGLSGTNQNISVSNVNTNFFSSLFTGGSAGTFVTTSNIIQRNGNGFGSSFTAANIGGDINIYNDQSGNVGIGTTLPASLFVVGAINQFKVSSTGGLTTNGNVGVSTTAPTTCGCKQYTNGLCTTVGTCS